MTINRQFGKLIRDYRRLRKLSIDDLAKASRVSKGSISKIENGNGNPSLVTVERLVKALKISIRIL